MWFFDSLVLINWYQEPGIIGKSKNKNWVYRDFSLESQPATCLVTKTRQQGEMEDRMGSMEHSMNSISAAQEEMREQMTELYNMVANIEKTR